MAYVTGGDTMVLYLGVLAPALVTLIAGLVIHSFIIAVNVNDWWKRRSVTPVDHIIIFLGISRMCTQCANTLYLFVLTLFLYSLNSRVTLIIMDALNAFFTYANIWLTSLLSIVFCLKISTLRTRLFLYLRGMIDRRIAHCIVASVLLSAMNCFIPLLVALSEVTKDGPSNTTLETLYKECSFINSIYNFTIGALIPLLFYGISSILLFFSLYNHTRRMKKSSNLSINLEAYYSAMRFVFFNFLYNALYFTNNFISVFYHYFYCVHLVWLHISLGFLPVLHSFYLTYRTVKLRSQMSKVLHNVIGFFIQRKDTETREDIIVVAQ